MSMMIQILPGFKTAVMLEFYFRFDFDLFIVIGTSASAYQMLFKWDHTRRNYDVIPVFQDGGHAIANLRPVSDLVTSPMKRSKYTV